MSDALWAPRMGAALLTLFGGLALILAAVGVYGVLSYSVNQQRHEIGIRRALGAQEGDVLRLVAGQGMRLAVVGFVVGLALAAVLRAFARELALRSQRHRSVDFYLVTFVLLAVALLACYIPARRAYMSTRCRAALRLSRVERDNTKRPRRSQAILLRDVQLPILRLRLPLDAQNPVVVHVLRFEDMPRARRVTPH